MKKSELIQIIKEELTSQKNVSLDVDGNILKLNDVVGLVDANIKDGEGNPLPGNTFKVIRVNPKTVTIEPTFPTWLSQVRLESNRVKLVK